MYSWRSWPAIWGTSSSQRRKNSGCLASSQRKLGGETASSPAWKRVVVPIRSSRRTWSEASQSSRSWVRSNSIGSQIPSFFDFWNSRIGTDSKSIPRREMLRYSLRVAIRPQSWTNERPQHTAPARLEPPQPGLRRDGVRPVAADPARFAAGLGDRAPLVRDQRRHRVRGLGLRLERASLPDLVPDRRLLRRRLPRDGADLPARQDPLRFLRRGHRLPGRGAEPSLLARLPGVSPG